MRLRTRLALTFGVLAAIGALAASHIVFTRIYGDLEALNAERLQSVATMISRTVDPVEATRFTEPEDWFTPAYGKLKRRLMDFQRANGLSWVALYRHDGRLFRAVADGSEQGDSFCPGFPIYDVSDNMRKALSGETGLVSIYTDSYGTYLMANSPLKGPDGAVTGIIDVSLSASKLTEARSRAMTRAAGVTVAVMFLAVLTSLLVSSRLARPVGLLEAGARELASGNLDHRVETAAGAPLEIRYLTDTFNEMAGSLLRSQNTLKMRITELGALCDLSKELSFAPSVETVIDSSLRKVAETIGCPGALFLTAEDAPGSCLDRSFGDGAFETLVTPEVSAAISSGTVVRGIATGLRDFEGATGGMAAFFAVPVRSEEKVSGSLVCFARPESSGFSEGEIHFAETVAGHLGLVLEKIRLYELAITDGLTGLFVHRYFQGALEREIKRARRYETETSLLLFDIDHFKNFNDTYGHQTGDVVIAGVADIVRNTIRDNLDIASRYGGEEFTVILPETGTDPALLVAERLRQAVESHEFTNGEVTVRVTISIGVATFPVHADERMALIARADEALYRCKEGGRNCSKVWEPVEKPESAST